MASYRIEWKRSAAKELKKLPPEIIKRILVAVESLAENPLPDGVKKLTGSYHTYRIREGVYRIIYNILSEIVVVEIIKVGHRKDVYRQRS
ncbi:MAG: type II toxin-antitoxin system RelE family toxin [Blastocatellia bacterium]